MVDYVVSVIVPIYNVEKYLEQCIKSILRQSYKNIEIILVDDGSPDNCGKMCDEYKDEDSRIKVMHKQNGGLSDARNAGINIATGEYITFVDSDDYIMPDMIEKLLSIALCEEADIVKCGYVRCNAEGVIKKKVNCKSSYKIYKDDRMKAYLHDKVIDTVAWGKMYKISLFQEIRFPKGKLHEDVFTTYRLIHEARSIAVMCYTGYVYRLNENSISTAGFTPKKLDIVEGKIEQAGFIEENYPELCQEAYTQIIYACNQCLLKMVQIKYGNEVHLCYLGKLYKKYGKYYIQAKTSLKGKIVAMLAMMNIKLAASVLGFLYGR